MLKPTLRINDKYSSCRAFLLTLTHVVLLCVGTLGAAQPAVSQVFDISALESAPATLEVSLDYRTVIEFGDMDVEIESIRSGDGSQVIAGVSGSTISLLANREDVETDLEVTLMDGPTLLFTLVSDPDAESPKRYVVNSEQSSASASEGGVSGDAGSGESNSQESTFPSLPPELEFRTSAYQPSTESMVIQYIVTNNTENLLANDPQRLRIYADGAVVPFERTLPEPGQAGRLTSGGAEYGEIFVPNVSVDADELTLEWELVEIGPGATYLASSDLLSALSEAPLPIPATVAADVNTGADNEADADAATDTATSPQTAEPTPEATTEPATEAPAATTSPAPQSPGASATSEDGELLPPEILEEIRRRGSDITVLGGGFDEPDASIVTEEADGTGVSTLDVWSLYTRKSAEAEATIEEGEACISVGGESALFQVQDIGFGYAGFPLTRGQTYRLSFDAYADTPVFFRSLVGLAQSPYSESFARVEALGTQQQTFFYTFEARSESDLSRVAFLLGGNQAPSFRICFDNIVLTEVGEGSLAEADAPAAPVVQNVLAENFDSEDAAQAWSSYTAGQAQMDYEISDGEVCATAGDGGAAIWDVGLLHPGLSFTDDQAYTLTFAARADKPLSVRPTVTLDAAPWTEVFGEAAVIGTEVQTYDYTFDAVSLEERGGRLIFYLGGNAGAPYRVCFDDLLLTPVQDGVASTAQGASEPAAIPSTPDNAPGNVASESSEPSNPQSESTVAPAEEPTALLLIGQGQTGLDAAFESRLAQLGFNALIERDSVAAAELAATAAIADLVVVSASVETAENIGASLRNTAVPMIISEKDLFAPLGMTENLELTYFGRSQSMPTVELVDPNHPLSAGLAGQVVISNQAHQLAWGKPSESGITVAKIMNDPNAGATVFAYEEGAPMIGMNAPARRVGLFFDYQGIDYRSSAWDLFDAAVDWAVQAEGAVTDATSNE